MERSRVTLIPIMHLLFSRISGTEVEIRVTPGDDVTLYSDCVWKIGLKQVWFRNSSLEHQPPLLITTKDLKNLPRYSLEWNPCTETHNLLVNNITESDLGLYYCAYQEKKTTGTRSEDVYHYGNRTIRLSLVDTTVRASPTQTPSTPPVSDCSVCWKLLTSAKVSASKTPTIISPAAPASEMERSRVTLITIMCALLSRISGAKVEMRVTPGDDVTLYSDCVWKAGLKEVWFRNSSLENQPPLLITTKDLKNLPRYSLEWNPCTETHNLLVNNITESDLGLYYCAYQEKKTTGTRSEDVYHYGNRTIRLSLVGKKNDVGKSETSENRKTAKHEEVGGDGVCYASLNLPSRGQKRLKKTRVESSDFSTYSEVKTDKM
ncbi:hypothetical protein AOLI_G00198540 [Acnodon oligacanthus]